MKLAAIDVGTNSIHTVIVEVGEDLSITILDSTKETVHLGRGRDRHANLSARAMTDALRALRRAHTLCERHEVERILAVATSAIREAPNGLHFLRLAEEKTGVPVHVISGSEEARLIYLAVRESVHLGGKPFLAIDIGGGSVEFTWATREEIAFSQSEKIGVLRLAEAFPLSDPATKTELRRLRDHLDERLSRLAEAAAGCPYEIVIGTSGTIHQICRLATGETALLGNKSLHQEIVPADAILDVCDRLIRSTRAERLEMKGLDRTRIQTIVPGAVLVCAIIEHFDVESILVCEYALREGVIYDYVARNRSGIEQEARIADPRMRSVLALARRCNWDEAHSRHVTKLALMIFDQLAPRFGWRRDERDLLEFSALLHDVGMLISVPNHHRHSQYLIEHADLLGFTPREVAIMANIVRYHRRAKPKKKHEAYRALQKRDRKIVDRLAGILRLAEAFDRTNFGLVQSVHCEMTDDDLLITAMAVGDAEVEHALAQERTDLLERAIGMKIRIQMGDMDLLGDLVTSPKGDESVEAILESARSADASAVETG